MRKWIKSACAVLACSIILLIVAVATSMGPSRSAQANTGTASYPQATLASHTVTATTAKNETSPATAPAATWTVRPGDTLSGIATDLAVPGGWQALYAVNRQAIGPNPDVIRAGTILVEPQPVLRTAPARASGRPGSAPAVPGHRATPAHKAPRPVPASPQPAPNARANPPAGGLPQWLKGVLLLAGLLAAAAFATEPIAAFVRRRRAAARHAKPRTSAGKDDRSACAVARARIILADHERLVVTYSAHDDTVYVLTPPSEDPQAVLRAARLVVPEDTYKDLADHLGAPSAWLLE